MPPPPHAAPSAPTPSPAAATTTAGLPHDLRQGPALTPISLVRGMARAYQRRGLDPSAALAAAQITPQDLAEPAGTITAAQMEAVSYAAMRELDDEGLGCFARALPWGSYGLLARASLSAPTLGVALKRWCRHHGLLTPDPALALETDGALARIRLRWAVDPGPMAELGAVSVLRNVHGLAAWFVDSRLPLRGVTLPYPAPPHVAAYAHLFDAPLTFDAPEASLTIDAAYLALPLRRDEGAMRALLQRALPLTVRSYRRDRLLVQRVRQALRASPDAMRNAEALAAALHTSVRTLHRQLRDEGATLQSLKDEVRRQLAQDLLRRTARPIKQIAAAVGFRSEKSFIRAFRDWTGQSPAAWREG